MKDIGLKTNGNSITLDFGAFSVNPDVLEERMREILPLLSAVISADSLWEALNDSQREARLKGFAAQDMMFQIALYETKRRAELLVAITDGSESIADHNFPEFSSENDLDV